jgi:hypothetical protein
MRNPNTVGWLIEQSWVPRPWELKEKFDLVTADFTYIRYRDGCFLHERFIGRMLPHAEPRGRAWASPNRPFRDQLPHRRISGISTYSIVSYCVTQELGGRHGHLRKTPAIKGSQKAFSGRHRKAFRCASILHLPRRKRPYGSYNRDSRKDLPGLAGADVSGFL